MKSFRSHIYLGVLCSLVCYSCKSPNNNETKQEDHAVLQTGSLPDGAIPFHYSNDTLKIILIDAVLNGTDSTVIYWDTGAHAMAMPTDYETALEGKDSICLKLGNQTVIYWDKIVFTDQYISSKERKRIVVGPSLFKDKVVEISYDRKYLRVLDNTDGLEGYECIPYRVMNGHLYAPLTLSVQGKVFFIKNTLLDTGFNGYFITGENHLPGVDVAGDKPIYATLSGKKKMTGHILLADSIKIGTVYTANTNIYVVAPDALTLKGKDFSNLLGNGFFSHFSVVFDFKNQNLYLKPLTK